MNRIVAILMLAGLTFASVGAAALAAPASTSDVERRGACSGKSRWELDLQRDHGGIELDLEVDTHASGDVWRVAVRHDGDVFLRARRVTDHEGDFDIERHLADHPGTDHFTARATNRATSETCRAAASI